MEFSKLTFICGRLFLMIFQILILVACFTYMQIVYTNNILPDKLVKETYIATSCTILSKDLATVGRFMHRYRANFLISYKAKGAIYQSRVTGNGLDQAYHHKRGPQEEMLAQFMVGNNYPCWYNPDIPQIAVLVLRHNWMSTLPLLTPSVVSLIALYYLIQGVIQLLGLIRDAFQDRKKHF